MKNIYLHFILFLLLIPFCLTAQTAFTLAYTPITTGAFSFDISIANDDADENPFNFTASGMAVSPAITSATYDAHSNQLRVSGSGFVSVTGAANDIDVSQLTLTGQGGASYTLTDSADVEITSATSFVVILSATDRTRVEGLLNKQGSTAVDGTSLTLSAATGFNGASSTADSGNVVTVAPGNLTAHTISTTADDARSVTSADVDGDGDIDVLSASFNDDKIAWYENDGSENFTAHTISTAADGAFSMTTADVDGDGDIDVLSASFNDNKIAWYENDGSENFTAHTISTTASFARSVSTADVDGDGDIDVLSASYADSKIAWYENDGNENFTAHTISTTADGATSVSSVDVDGDGDIDVLSASIFDDKIAWYENDGSENFTAHTISTNADGAYSVTTADMDGDGDIDVLSASYVDNKIAWYENDGSENFTAHNISTAADNAYSVTTADVDGDGDIDVLSASYNDDKIAWYENDGSENFTAHTISTAADGARSVTTADVDGDGDIDVLSASINDDKIAWYENGTDFGPAVDSATYDFATGGLVVNRSSTGTGLVSLSGANNDIDASLLTLTGEAGATYTLTDSADVEITDENSFTLTLSATDKTAVNALLNKNGTTSIDATTYNLSLAAGFNGVGAALDTPNAVTVSGIIQPEISVSSSESGTLTDGGTDAQGDETAGVSKTVTYTITNSGTATLTLSGTASVTNLTNITGTPTVSAYGSTTVATSGGTTTFTVAYTPTTAGAFSFDISIANDDADENPFNFTASGTATALGGPDVTLHSIRTYPVPVIDRLMIDLGQYNNGEAQLFDIVGRSLLKKTLDTSKTTIDVRAIPSGLYLLHLEVADGHKIIKVIKE